MYVIISILQQNSTSATTINRRSTKQVSQDRNNNVPVDSYDGSYCSTLANDYYLTMKAFDGESQEDLSENGQSQEDKLEEVLEENEQDPDTGKSPAADNEVVHVVITNVNVCNSIVYNLKEVRYSIS